MMDRLTIPYELSNGYHRSPNTTWNTILNRLAEYEDTGLTPSEILEIQSGLEKLSNKFTEIETEIKKAVQTIKTQREELSHYKQLEAEREKGCKVCGSLIAMRYETVCDWSDDGKAIWDTNVMHYCPKCGKKLEVQP